MRKLLFLIVLCWLDFCILCFYWHSSACRTLLHYWQDHASYKHQAHCTITFPHTLTRYSVVSRRHFWQEQLVIFTLWSVQKDKFSLASKPCSAVWGRIINTRALTVKLPLEDLPQLFQVPLKQSCMWDLLVSPLSLPLALQNALDLSLSFSFLGGKKRHFQMSWKTLKFLPLIFLNLKVNGKETMFLAVKFLFINVIFLSKFQSSFWSFCSSNKKVRSVPEITEKSRLLRLLS